MEQTVLVVVHTGMETVHGQSVMVRVVGAVTVYVTVPCVITVAEGQKVVKELTTDVE